MRSDGADIRLSSLFTAALAGAGAGHSFGAPSGFALVAVGGYGRRELAPASDLDVLLVHADRRHGEPGRDRTVAGVADRLWYPLWDDGVRLDHAVRTVAQARSAAAADLRTALGLLDARHLAGDPSLTTQLRTSVLADWRGSARRRLPQLRDSVHDRWQRYGELAHAQAGDLKAARGGLRDIVVLDALVASWLIDVPHRRIDAARQSLLDVRDALHAVTGRPGDHLAVEDQPDVAAALGLSGRTELLRAVSAAARAVALIADVAWRRVGNLLQRAPGRAASGSDRRNPARPGPVLVGLADGVAEHDGEVVLTADADPADPDLVMRVAATAARTGHPIAPATADRLARTAAVPVPPWPESARRHLLDALGSGTGLVAVWEVLDEAGLLDRLSQIWARIRCLPSDSPVHRWTVDRHSIGAVVAAASLLRRVDRPDLLLIAALLHDIGKGVPGDHSRNGEPLAHAATLDLGFPVADARTVALLVRHHLLLAETATTRDVDDPATAAVVAAVVADAPTLELLAALTEADALATGPAAWSPWRAGLVRRLASRVRPLLTRVDGEPVPGVAGPVPVAERLRALGVSGTGPEVVVGPSESDTHTLVTLAPDRPGLLAILAGVLTVDRLVVRTATVATGEGMAVVDWTVTRAAADPPDPVRLRGLLVRALDGGLNLAERLAARDGARNAATDAAPVADPRSTPVAAPAPAPAAAIDVVPDGSATATVLQVRAADRPGLLFAVCSGLTAAGAQVRSAHVATLGGQVVDVFYLLDAAGRPLSEQSTHRVRREVAAALS